MTKIYEVKIWCGIMHKFKMEGEMYETKKDCEAHKKIYLVEN